MKVNICLITLGTLYMCGSSYAQTDIGKLSKGDIVPDATLQMANYSSKHARLSDFTTKHIILDFFSIYCGSCIAELPRLDSLQKIYKDKLQFIVISSEPLADVKKFLANNPRVKGISLPFVAADTVLVNMFPHTIVPHEVWLDDNFNVKAITDQYEVSVNNINRFLDGDELGLPLKKDLIAFTHERPLFEQGNVRITNSLKFCSVFYRYIPGAYSASGQLAEGALTRFYYINIPLYMLYAAAYGMPANRIISNIPDTIDYLTQHTAWNARWLYSYEITLPENYPTDKRNLLMQQDLQRYTGCHARIEERTIPCWLLKKITITKEDVPYTPIEDAMISVQKGENTAMLVLQINNVLSESELPPIVFDSVKETLDTSIIFSPRKKTIDAVQKVLNAYGFTLVPHEATLPMVIISNKPD